MSFQPRGYGLNGKSTYENVCKPIKVSCNFIVDSANGNGLGIRSLKSNGFMGNVFMHTSAPLAGSGNPNPIAGYAVLQFENNFNKYLGGWYGTVAPLAGGTSTSTTANTPAVITSLGTATLAQWVAVGFPLGFVPAVGFAFIPSVSALIGGAATVEGSGVSQVCNVQVLGDANQSLNNLSVSVNGGAQLIIQFVDYTGALITPPNGSVVALRSYMDGSSVSIDGL